jgi:hypothetical protein
MGGICLALCLSLAIVSGAGAQSDPNRPVFWRHYNFNFPVKFSQNTRNVSEIKLFYSLEQGPWTLLDSSKPERQGFDVRLNRDGKYAFATQTIFTDGRMLPEKVENLRPETYLTVDTTLPSIALKSMPPRPLNNGEVAVGVMWDVRDAYLDLSSLRLEGRYDGSTQWMPIQTRPVQARGEETWRIPPDRKLEVRLTARDQARNVGEATVTLGRNVGVMTGGTGEAGEYGMGRSAPHSPGIRLVNNRKITLDFKIRDRGPSGVGSIDLWVTRNRQDWKKIEPSSQLPGDGAETASLTFQAPTDGTYGFTIIARSRANLAQPDPIRGDEPMVWIEVDETKPEAEFVEVKFATPGDPRSLMVTWKATDKNLDPQAVILEYSETQNGDWKLLAEGLATNSQGLGRHTMATPVIKSYQFWLRMRVVDRAGNQKEVVYDKPINIDLTKPSIEILDVKQGKP